ncbi:MAG TPA: ABC transporter ATP-binding protein [Firmicutes bacterium]|nr:ABC transporter ATP-binding protein [Bacillota bacterium]
MTNKEPERRQGTIRDLMLLVPYIKPQLGKLWAAIGLMIAASLISIFMPMFIRSAIDNHIIDGNLKGLFTLVSLAVALTMAMSGANILRARLMAYVGQSSIKAVRNDLFAKMQLLPVKFFDKVPVGKLITRLTSDVDALQELVGNAIVSMVIDSLKLVGFLAVMFWLDWRLTLVTLAVAPILAFALTYLTARIGKAEDLVREQTSVVNTNLQESISGIRVIQGFNAEEYFHEKFQKENHSLLQAGMKAIATYSYFWPTVDLSWVLSSAAILFFGGRWVLDGTTTPGTLVAMTSYAGQFFGPLRGLSQAYRIIQRALAGAVRINEIMASEVEVDENLPPMPPIRGSVEFDQVTFGYDPDEIVLHNISIKAEPGETIALVGHTGAGKTSIINLLCRFYDPLEGRILVDGINIHEHELASYRRQIGLVLQDPFLFSGTLRENLQFGKPTATDEEIWKALETVGLAETFAQHNVTLDTVLTERGANFSTGQRQLISFARALISDPRILILDEATAHVDTLTEQKVQRALAELLKGRTSFVIAHRLSTIRNADQIIVIGKGRILEQGTHEELLALKGEYWQLSTSQMIAKTE